MNKQTKALKKAGMSSRNNGEYTVVSPINHGKYAFQKPAEAIERKRREGVRTWKISKRHPNQPQTKGKENHKPTLSKER